jgi:hypothetical protein
MSLTRTAHSLVGVLLAVGLAGGLVASAQQTAADPSFACLANKTKVRHTFFSHPEPAKLKEALRIFENHETAEYPVGTVIQMVPNEAMIKRTRAEFPKSNGWEFFLLDVTAQGTVIKMRGDSAANRLGTCLSCHQGGVKYDMVCEHTHGCTPVPVTDEVIAKVQASDPRCAK